LLIIIDIFKYEKLKINNVLIKLNIKITIIITRKKIVLFI
jgi:hypothetical protein